MQPLTNLPMRHLLPAFALLSVPALSAQQNVTIPGAFATSDAPSAGDVAGFSTRMRQQFLIGGAHLGALTGKTVDAIWWRRNAAKDAPIVGGLADLKLVISMTDVAPDDASSEFARNHGPNPVSVLQARITVPDSPAIGTDRWSGDQTVRLVLQTGFFYTAGNLCIDIEGTPVVGSVSPIWLIDNDYQPLDGAATPFGQSCVGFANPTYDSLRANADTLAVGATGFVYAYSRPGSLGVLLIGALGTPGGLDLSGIGMTGCRSYVTPMVAISATPAAVPSWGSSRPWQASIDLPIPAITMLLSGFVHAQFASLELNPPFSNPLHVTMSQGLQLRIASQPMTLGMATISSRSVAAAQAFPSNGRVAPNRGPVVRFLFH